MKMKAVSSLLFLNSLPFINSTQAMFTGHTLYSRPGAWGQGYRSE